ncbi:hypothetical protein LEP48_01275 [Isoptericola sp. NEAU-Y5]|uniref:Uncharacterized protein n=1 Tax=Isoptericola luteus TaxID=2879484 RepID=A0ABS7ZCF2_9MICO|nr:hypothetical protein [Isoptericola sp. NEAU-Y5]MCA5891981.1 hypothetical protein [Isoptericola sp. NEAU-Y5]
MPVGFDRAERVATALRQREEDHARAERAALGEMTAEDLDAIAAAARR